MSFTRALKYSIVLVALACGSFACGGSEPEPRHAHKARARREARETRSPAKLEELEPKRVVMAIRGNELELRKCFFRAPNARGIIRMRWQIDTTGATRNIAVQKSTIGNAEVERCLVAHVEELRFGELERPAKAAWTFVFRLADPFTDEPKTAKSKKKNKKNKKKRKASDDSDEPGIRIEPTSPGWLEPDKIDDVVHFGYQLFAHCYRAGIERETSLNGTMRLRFVINEQGRVAKVFDGVSNLPDPMTIDCVAETFYALEFPKPERGHVQVLYRVQFN